MIEIVKPIWPAPDHIYAGVTTRHGGVSHTPFDKLNLATHVGDNPSHVNQNRRYLDDHCRKILNKELTWHWLNQTHSSDVIYLEKENTHAKETQSQTDADASFTATSGRVCVVLTADCLPILISNRKGSVVAAIHAGWRGLRNGIIQNTVASMCDQLDSPQLQAKELIAWLGPAIGPNSFEVGGDVRDAFLNSDLATDNHRNIIEAAFRSQHEEKYLCDLYQLATLALNLSGVSQIYGGGLDTYQQTNRFYSYRRSNLTGRIASFIFIKPQL